MQFCLLFYDYYSTTLYINSQGILDTLRVCMRACAFYTAQEKGNK